MQESDRTPPRFPFVAAALCAGCIGAAASTWMRYSYCWQTSVTELTESVDAIVEEGWPASTLVHFNAPVVTVDDTY